MYLISSGIKNLNIFDGDLIEISNLNRQTLYTIDEIGKSKADVSKKRLLKTNPNCKITAHSYDITENNINLLSDSSIIIDTTDDWKTTKIINQYSVKNSKPYIFASAVSHDIQIGIFDNTYKKHICLNCLFPNKDDVELARCETIGIYSITAGIAGLITAQKTLNYLLNFNKENNILTIFNVLSTKIDNIKVKNNKECLLNKG